MRHNHRVPFDQALEAIDDVPSNPSVTDTLSDIVDRRYTRRQVLKGALGVGAMAGLLGPLPLLGGPLSKANPPSSPPTDSSFNFTGLPHGVDTTHHVAPGHRTQVLLRWGDPVLPGAPPFDPKHLTAAAQELQFGYNNDYVGFIPLPLGSGSSDHGLLCVNHEYTSRELIFPELITDTGTMTQEQVRIEMAAHGGSVVEIRRDADDLWQVVADSRYARRITANTPMRLSGPAAGHPRLQTAADPTGTEVLGTVNNCAGGITPWGTYLMAEENFQYYFSGGLDTLGADHPEHANHQRCGVSNGSYKAWARVDDRWNLAEEPREPNRFGWIVEVDPLDPRSVPVKRTALGRFKHEGAESIVNRDGRLVLYSGDDQAMDYVYKFVSRDRYDPDSREANRNLLDHGTLFVARFHDDGTVRWLPLVHGQNGLTPENDFDSQAEVLIETRRAADVLGATPMDRPEDVQPNPVTGSVYIMLTNNSGRLKNEVDGANPRVANLWGQIVEVIPPNGDHAAETARWELLVACGNPQDPKVQAVWNADTGPNEWFACPDNAAVDHQGRLWIATDQGGSWSRTSGSADGFWALGTEGAERGLAMMLVRCPVGAEMCGPVFTPDDTSLFLAMQHVSRDGAKDFEGFERRSTFRDPSTRWPDFDPKIPPRPSVVVVTREGGGRVG